MRIFGANRKAKFQAKLKELQIAVSAAPIKFSTAILEAVEPAMGVEGEYPRLFSDGPPKSATAPLNQMVLAIEGLCFYLHLLSRVSYRGKNEQLREAVFDPTVREMAHLFGNMTDAAIGPEAAELTMGAMEEEILRLISQRESEYGQKEAIFGDDVEYSNTALATAITTICQSVGQERHILLKYAVRTELLRCLIDIELPSSVGSLEKAL